MSRPRRLLALILFASIAVRLLVAVYLGDTVPSGKDETSYHMLAVRLADGHGYSFPTGWYPFTPPNSPTSHWSFLYTGLLAGLYGLLGPHPLAGRLAGAIAGGLLLPWLTYRLARRMTYEGRTHEVVPLAAAALAAGYAYFALFAAQLMTETLFICALLWSLERAMALAEALGVGAGARSPVEGVSFALGAALAGAVLTRQSILPWVVVLFAFLLHSGLRSGNGRRATGAVAIAATVISVVVAPFTLRNLWVYEGDFLLLNSNAGYAMYAAQHPGHGTSFRAYWGAPLPDDLAGLELNEAEWDRALMLRGVEFILAEPRRYLRLSLSRVRDYFEFWPTSDSPALFNLGRVLSAGIMLPTMAAGIAVWLRPAARREFGLKSPTLPLLFVGFYSAMHLLTWAMPRYRLPVDAVALVFAALPLMWLRDGVAQWWIRRGKPSPQ